MKRESFPPVIEGKATFNERLLAGFNHHIPHASAIGLHAESATPEQALARLPFRPEFIGDTERGTIHTAVISSLIDSSLGLAVMAHGGRAQAIATLDLRIDYLRSARAGLDLHCRAECYRTTRHIAFARAEVWQDDATRIVATGVGTFMCNPTTPRKA